MFVVRTKEADSKSKYSLIVDHPSCPVIAAVPLQEMMSRLYSKAHLKLSDILSFLLEGRLVSDRLAPVSSLQAWNDCLGSTFALSSPVRDWERCRSFSCSSERDTQNDIKPPFISLDIFTINTQIPQILNRPTPLVFKSITYVIVNLWLNNHKTEHGNIFYQKIIPKLRMRNDNIL